MLPARRSPFRVRHPRAARLLVATIAAVVVLLPAAPVAPAGAADGTGAPANPLLGPALLDPVIGLLGPVPTKYVPYRGDLCRDGARSCIDDTIAEMQRRLAPVAQSCSHRAIFSLAYLRVTEDVRTALDAGHFKDRVWLQQVDKVFAHLYFDTLDDWDAGRKSAVPAAWRIALQAEDDRSMSGLGNFLLAMNAHINRDFPHVLATVGLNAADGTSHKADHNAYNPRLDGLYHPVFTEEAARFDPTFDDIDLGQLDEIGVGAIMRGWREVVWRHAEALVAAPAFLKPLVEQQIEQYAALQAQLIKAVFRANPTKRDAWCAQHHG